MKHKFIKIKIADQLCDIHYTEFGEKNRDLVICLHGINRNCRDFDYIANFISRKYHVICPDIVGRGQSSWLKNKDLYNYYTYATIVEELIKNLNKDNVSLIGTSMGGIIGIYLISNMKCKSFIINDIGPDMTARSIAKLIKNLKPKRMKNKEEMLKYMRVYLSPLFLKDEEIFLHFAYNSVRKLENGSFEFNYDPDIVIPILQSSPKDYLIYNLWNKISCPILILRGAKSNILTKELAKKMLISKENIQMIEYEDSAHTPSLTEEIHILDVFNWLQENKS